MNDQNRARLARMVARWDRERAATERHDAERRRREELAFHQELAHVFGDVLRPVIDEIRAELRLAGHDCRAEESSPNGSPRLDLFVVVAGRRGSKDLIQFIVRTYPDRGSELIAELVLRSSPFELCRFATPSELTADVAEQMIVDAIEQILASPAT